MIKRPHVDGDQTSPPLGLAGYLFDFVTDLPLSFFICPWLWLCQGVVGVACPVEDPSAQRLRAAILLLMGAAIGLLLSTFYVLPWFGISFSIRTAAFILGYIALAIAAWLGYTVERTYLMEQRRKTISHDER